MIASGDEVLHLIPDNCKCNFNLVLFYYQLALIGLSNILDIVCSFCSLAHECSSINRSNDPASILQATSEHPADRRFIYDQNPLA
jgi:hypothetical protein